LDSLSTTSSTTRHDRRRQATADRIVEAAGALFGERGVEATKVSDICERADVAHQTFFNHFPTKQDLVRELVRRGHDFLIDAIETVLSEESSTEGRIARLFAEIHAAAASAGPMHQDIVSETLRAAHEEKDPASTRRLHRAIEALVRAGRAQGDVTRQHAAEDLVALVVGALSQLMLEWAHRADFDIAPRSRRMARLLADALAPRAGERTRRS
jgi:AcrR family transcriptional regulator